MPSEVNRHRGSRRRAAVDSGGEGPGGGRLVPALRAELGTHHGTKQRVTAQLEYEVESVRAWVRQAGINDGIIAGVRLPGGADQGVWAARAQDPETPRLRSSSTRWT